MIKGRQFPPSSAAECIPAALSITVKEIERQRLRNFFISLGVGCVEMSIPPISPTSPGQNANISAYIVRAKVEFTNPSEIPFAKDQDCRKDHVLII